MARTPHSRDLRKGRVSESNRIYLVTTVTLDRQPCFQDLRATRHLATALREAQRIGDARTLAYVAMPDHLHWLMQLGDKRNLSKVVGQ